MTTRRVANLGGAAAGAVVLLLASCAAGAGDQTEILVYQAYGTPRAFTLEGRVAERQGRRAARGADSWSTNLWLSLRSLRVSEKKDIPLRLTFASSSWTVRSDTEGYFAVRADTPPQARPGWNPVRIAGADGGAWVDAQVLIVPERDTIGIISDFDDTLILSEVTDRSRLLEHSLLENHLQRRPIEGMAALYRAILARNPLPDAAPVFYLTASPRQLEPGIRAFLERNGFPPGPIVAKKVSDRDGDPLFDQERYKIERIERIFEDLPSVRFILVGDDGERDPETYSTIRARHPSRIEAVYIRHASPDPGRRSYPDQMPPPVR